MLLSLTPKNGLWKLVIGSVVAIAPFLFPANGLAQNQSDVTGPNLSDVTGPNLSDVTGPNQSDSTGVLIEPIFEDADGELLSLAELFEDFFEEFGDELGIDPDASLIDKLRQANRACSDADAGTRRFARTPGSDAAPSLACTEFFRLIQLAQEALDQYSQSRGQTPSAPRRIW